MVDHWLVLELHVQYGFNLLQDKDCGANLVRILPLDNSGHLFRVLLIKWTVRVTKGRLCSKIFPNLWKQESSFKNFSRICAVFNVLMMIRHTEHYILFSTTWNSKEPRHSEHKNPMGIALPCNSFNVLPLHLQQF